MIHVTDIFRRKLAKYINSGSLSRSDCFVSIFSRKLVFWKNSKKLIELYKDLPRLNREDNQNLFTIKINEFNKSNFHVLEMMSYLDKSLSSELIGACVHGSLGSYEEIAYSDFDALVIIKNDVFEDHKRLSYVARKLSEARSIMYRFDLLQHHDWFVFTEVDLGDYPETYFPHELFAQAKSLSADALKFKIRISNQTQDHCRQFTALANRILHKVQNSQPANVYQLKGFLSECMLLPALYVQCRTGKGIFKKLSFAAAKADFSPEVWSVMGEISEIRTNWSVSFNRLQYFLLSSINPLLRELGKKIAPRIPEPLRSQLDKSFYTRIEKLVLAMRAKANNEKQIL